MVVVVECHLRGGALYTAEAAARRGIPVGAVPGSVRSPASSGCNALLADGCTPIRDVADVLAAVDLARAERPASWPATILRAARCPRPADAPGGGQSRGRAASAAPVAASEEERRVWEAVEDHPTTLETILLRTGLSIAAVAMACEALLERGQLHGGPGWWSRA